MSFWDILGTLLIKPLQLLFEVVFVMANRVVGDPGLAIIALSLAMNFLVLPLYRRADAMQEEEREMELRLHKGVAHIKKTFRGDERMMMLQTYYRQNNYKPTYVLKGATSLFLEIPFFIAAYAFLSNLELLHGVSFGPIRDLGAPDGLLTVAGVTVNVLPFLMTAINLVSCVIFTKGSLPKTKVQLYAMALFFLVFLYTSPAGLVFYWTLNNLFSLLKTIFYKLRHASAILGVLFSLAGIAAAVYGLFFYGQPTPRRLVFFVAAAIVLQLPLLSVLCKGKVRLPEKLRGAQPSKKLFVSGGIFLAVLTGLLIPSAVIHSSPQEFVDMTRFLHPVWYIVSAFCFAVGTFVIWFGIFYSLAKPSVKAFLDKCVWALCGIALVDYMFFGRSLGNLSAGLIFDNGLQFTTGQMLVNLAVVLVIFAAFAFAASRWRRRIPGILAVGIIAVVCMSAVNTVGICRSINEIKSAALSDGGMPTFSLSKTGKNVVVLMIDRAIGPYIPYIFNEKPELEAQFDGFTYYRNTASLGVKTNISTPSLFGGYEYTPAELNTRDQELLVDKHNEALKVLPVMFDQNGFDVTVLQPVYANYQYTPDLSIFDDYPDIRKFNVCGQFTDPEIKRQSIKNNKRNFFCYALMKAAPLCVQTNLYDYGAYNQGNVATEIGYGTQTGDDMYTASGISKYFMDSYNVLGNLPNITRISKGGENTYMVLTNETTHELMLLQEPEYAPTEEVDNTQYEREHADRFTLNGQTLAVKDRRDYMHYQCNVAALLQLGKWFDYLRANGVYDNTRIIIMSDHGNTLGQVPELITDYGLDTEGFASLLLVKDFNSTGFTTSNEFMLSADVPLLAVKDVIAEPVNPFTGHRIDELTKPKEEQRLLHSFIYDVKVNCGTQFIAGDWYTVNGDIWNKNAWTQVASETVLTNAD